MKDFLHSFIFALNSLRYQSIILIGVRDPHAFTKEAGTMGGNPYVGMVLPVGFTFAPNGWLSCDGSLQPISQYETLFALIGTTYGGDGQSTFGLPDLRGRTPLHFGGNYVQGQLGGLENVTLTINQMPIHNHQVNVNSNNQSSASANNAYVAAGPLAFLKNPNQNVTLAAASIQPQGGSTPHANLQPYLTLNWIIAWAGIFPSQT
jgi:microcystin-dependent protein